MAAYDYRCRRCGVYEARFPVGTAPARHVCPGCGAATKRVFSPPAVLPKDTALSRAIDADRRSAHEPAVVSAPLPARPRQRQPANPLHAKLPRP
jgi:putative FmdB family regulatory protein